MLWSGCGEAGCKLNYLCTFSSDEVAMNQQVNWFIKFRSQIGSVCDMVKVNPNIPQYSRKDYIVLYPFYDIRVYNKTQDMPDAVKSVCRGDKCACLLKLEEGGTADWLACAGDDACIQGRLKIAGVYSCFNMDELGCNKELWLGHNVTTTAHQLRNYSYKNRVTCKTEGLITWDRKAFFYDKLSEYCSEAAE